MEAAEAVKWLRAAGHLVCRQCGQVADVDCAAFLEPVRKAGYVVDQAEVTFLGQCARCQAQCQTPEISDN